MNDSKELNEKKEGIVANTPYEEEVKGSTAASPKVDNDSSKENNIISGVVVSLIVDQEVVV